MYALAVKNLPQQRVNDFNLKAAAKRAQAAKANMNPTFSAFGGLSSKLYQYQKTRYIFPTGTYSSTILSPQVDIGGTIYKVTSPDYTIVGKQGTPFFKQIDNNFRQQVGMSISVPIFNGGQLSTNYQRAKLNIKNAELQQDLDNQKIKQDIYQAYNAATVALEKFNSSEKSVSASQRTYDFALKTLYSWYAEHI